MPGKRNNTTFRSFTFSLSSDQAQTRACTIICLMGCELAVWCDWAAYSLENGWMPCIYCTPLRMTMMTRGEMRIRPEETGPTNWILFCPWLAMRWDWETCGGSLISLSKMVEVRQEFLGQWFFVFYPQHANKRKTCSEYWSLPRFDSLLLVFLMFLCCLLNAWHVHSNVSSSFLWGPLTKRKNIQNYKKICIVKILILWILIIKTIYFYYYYYYYYYYIHAPIIFISI